MRDVIRFRKRARPALTVALASLIAITPSAWSSMLPDLSPFAGAKVLSDEKLGGMRGRYAAGGQIVQFGVEMATQWMTANGENLSASAILHVNMSGATPQVQFVPNLTIASADAAARPAAGVQSIGEGGGGLGAVTGVTQAIQVAGDRNSVIQDATVEISSSPIAPPRGGTAAGPSNMTLSSASGASVSASLSSEGMSVAASVPDQGRIVQRIRGAEAPGRFSGGVIQWTRIAGESQAVRNAVTIRVQTLPGAQLGGGVAGMRSALQSLRGLRAGGAG